MLIKIKLYKCFPVISSLKHFRILTYTYKQDILLDTLFRWGRGLTKSEYSKTKREHLEILNVTFVVDDVKIEAHKIVLLPGSHFFNNILNILK